MQETFMQAFTEQGMSVGTVERDTRKTGGVIL
jgi:hypothetical protein